MIREQFQIGMIVEFGRGNGEWTKGQIIKLNPKMAKVKTLESRGSGNGSQAGSVWSVAYGLMRPSNGTATAPVAFQDPADQAMPYNRFNPHCDHCIMEAIVDIYNRLSPEWLTADGERPISQVRALRSQLESKLHHLFKALGRPVSETVAYDWDKQKEENTRKAV